SYFCCDSTLCYSSPNHRDLPSFPTRRSSDLARELAVHARVRAGEHHGHAAPAQVGDHFLERLQPCLVDERHPSQAHDEHARIGADRKSTRLNSSHVKTSYAVFCLKKKINDTR